MYLRMKNLILQRQINKIKSFSLIDEHIVEI